MIFKIGLPKTPPEKPAEKTKEILSRKEVKKKDLECLCVKPLLYGAVLWCACVMSLVSSGFSLFRQHELETRLLVLEEQHLALRSAVLETTPPVRLRRETPWRSRRSLRDYGACDCPAGKHYRL